MFDASHRQPLEIVCQGSVIARIAPPPPLLITHHRFKYMINHRRRPTSSESGDIIHNLVYVRTTEFLRAKGLWLIDLPL